MENCYSKIKLEIQIPIGNPKRISKDVKRLIIDKRREHSRKPEQTYDRIEKLVEGPYLELFARKTRRNWDSWGDQVGLFDNKNQQVNTRKRVAIFGTGKLNLRILEPNYRKAIF